MSTNLPRGHCDECGALLILDLDGRVPSHRVAGTADQRCTGSRGEPSDEVPRG